MSTIGKGLPQQAKNIVLCLILALVLVGNGCSSSDESTPVLSPMASAVVTPAPTELPATITPTPTPASGSIEVLSSGTEADFPASITFSLEAESQDEISRIVLRYKIKKILLAQVATEVEPEFDNGKYVETSWEWDTRKQTLPPGAEIQYQWIIEDSAKRKTQTPWTTFVVEDERYDWNNISEGRVALYWYKGTQDFGQQLMDAAQGGLEKLAIDTGAHPEKPVKVYIYGSQQALLDALVYAQSWTGGVAFTEYGILSIGVAPENLEWGEGAMVHELAHLVTYQMTYNPYGDIPTWLSEGISMYAEGSLDEAYQSILTESISQDTLISVKSLSSSFPADASAASLAYAESYSIVDFLVHEYGQAEMLELLNVFEEGSSYDSALQEVYSFDTEGLEELWRIYIGAN